MYKEFVMIEFVAILLQQDVLQKMEESLMINDWKWLILFQSLLCLLFFLYTSLYYFASLYDYIDADQKHRQAGIVLGAALWDNEPSPALKERLNLALQLLKQHKIDYLILSGGKGKAKISEAEAMAQYLINRGISKERIILEAKSSNTKENMLYSAKLIQQYGFQEVYIITHDYHMFRALAYARKAKIQAAPAPVHSTVLWPPFHKTRECLAMIKQYLFDFAW